MGFLPRRETVGAMNPLTALTLAARVKAVAADRAVCWKIGKKFEVSKKCSLERAFFTNLCIITKIFTYRGSEHGVG